MPHCRGHVSLIYQSQEADLRMFFILHELPPISSRLILQMYLQSNNEDDFEIPVLRYSELNTSISEPQGIQKEQN